MLRRNAVFLSLARSNIGPRLALLLALRNLNALERGRMPRLLSWLPAASLSSTLETCSATGPRIHVSRSGILPLSRPSAINSAVGLCRYRRVLLALLALSRTKSLQVLYPLGSTPLFLCLVLPRRGSADRPSRRRAPLLVEPLCQPHSAALSLSYLARSTT